MRFAAVFALVVASARGLAPTSTAKANGKVAAVRPFHVHVGAGKLGLALVVPSIAAAGGPFSVGAALGASDS